MEIPKHPYVVSGDIKATFGAWTRDAGYTAPTPDFFNGMSRDLVDALRQYHPDVQFVPDEELRAGINRMIASSAHDVVTLDRAYVEHPVAGYIDVTRAVDPDLNDIGILPRPGALPLDQQLKKLHTRERTPIVIVDDVIFGGSSMERMVRLLEEKANRQVVGIIAGIAVEGGIKKLQDRGIKVEAVRTYAGVIDEVCERDFRPGIPLSGRTVYDARGGKLDWWSAPYIQPFGKPTDWATIPKANAQEFSALGIEQAILFWGETERVSGKSVPVSMLPRRVKGLPESVSVVHSLKELQSMTRDAHQR